MSHWVYILYSPSADRYYVGESADVIVRLDQHNTHFFRQGFTRIASDWRIVAQLECADRSHARRVEAYIKRQKKRSFIERVVKEEALREWFVAHA